MAMASAAASTASPMISPPISRVLNGNVAAASVTLTLRALGKSAEYGLGLGVGAGVTLGKSPPGELSGLGSSGSVAGLVVSGRVGRMPAGSVAPRPAVLSEGAGVGVGDGEAEGLGLCLDVMSTAPDAGGGAVASPDLAVAERITCVPLVAVPFGTATLACSSSELPLATPPTLQVSPLVVGHTVNLGEAPFPAALALTVTLTLLAAPPAGQTQMA
jgi:hypothetical protein